MGDDLYPVNAEGEAVGCRFIFDQYRSGAIGEHPAQELRFKGKGGMIFTLFLLPAPCMAWKKEVRIKVEASSEPVATARLLNPWATDMAPYFKAVMPERQIPAVLITSQGSQPNSPCTMEACPGMS
jgi:hypothetical protein